LIAKKTTENIDFSKDDHSEHKGANNPFILAIFGGII
jgi:hypothetical protein